MMASSVPSGPARSAHQHSRYDSLDLWRGVACLSVIAYHATGPGAPRASLALQITAELWLGVPLFFVISGYCIAASAERTEREQASVAEYFRRRARRIFVPFWCATALTAASTAAIYALGWGSLLSNTVRELEPIGAPQGLTVWQWVGNITLSETWRDQTVAPAWVLAQAWTLAYEEQFYAVTGLLLFAFRRDWLMAAAALSATLVIYLGLNPSVQVPRGVFWDGQWFLFACGLAVYAFLHRSTRTARAGIVLALIAGAGGALAQPNVLEPVPLQLLVAATFAGLLIVLHPYDSRMNRRALRPLQWCGDRCYSIYLLHWPITKTVVGVGVAVGLTSPGEILGLVVPASIAGSLAAAALFHALVERRFLSTSRGRVEPMISRSPVTAGVVSAGVDDCGVSLSVTL